MDELVHRDGAESDVRVLNRLSVVLVAMGLVHVMGKAGVMKAAIGSLGR